MTRNRSKSGLLTVIVMVASLIPIGAIPAQAATIVINEIDADTPGTDVAEFVELYDGGVGNTPLDGLVLVFYNGANDLTYGSIDLDGLVTDESGYVVLCGDAADIAALCDRDASVVIQNGADAVALYEGNAADFPGNRAIHVNGLLDAVVYDGGEADDPELLVLTPGQPQVDENGKGSSATHSLQRCPNGSGGPLNTGSFSQFTPTTGTANTCEDAPPPPPPPPPPPTSVIINEVDADTPGVDAAEFVELFDGGSGETSLDGLTLVFYNGANDAVYDSADLDGLVTDTDGYIAICGDATDIAAICDVDLGFGFQNGADAVALYQADATTFPNGAAITLTGLADALVYDTSDADDPGLLALLNPGEPQVDENGALSGAEHSNQRCPNGAGGARNTTAYAQFAPTPGVENTCTVVPPDPVVRKIHEIQGAGTSSPLDGTAVVVEAVVVGDFQGNQALRGFNLQEEDADIDTDPLTSEGIFVFDGSFGVDVSVGDLVEVSGTVDEFNGLTEITSVTSVTIVSTGNAVTPATLSLPVTALDDYEAFEGMSVVIPQTLFISEFFNFDRFGEIVLTSERQFQPTAIFAPGSPEAGALAAANVLGRITLDDGRSGQNPDPAIHPNGGVFDLDNLFRGGDRVANVTGVLDFSFGLYRVHPTAGADFTSANPRPRVPKVGGNLRVATFNVLNYFSTIDTGAFICGPLADQECRGADNAEELVRQRDKIVTALAKLDADVVGLMEIENHATDAALADLVAALNQRVGRGTYAYVGEGSIGPDAIRVGIIYQPKKVRPVGADAVLDSDEFLDPNGLGGAQNRPAQAQTFKDKKTGERFTVVVNHLKSKGSGCGPGDDDPVQGNCNLTRTLSAGVLMDWLATDPTGAGDPDYLVIGDLNSYDKEDPIRSFAEGGLSDLLHEFQGEEAYTYLFDGQLGNLDYALANPSMRGQVTGATAWHLNADEPDLIDYDTGFKLPPQQAIYAPDQFRSSDHDAVVVGLRLDGKPPRVKAGLDRLSSHGNSGVFRVEFSCRDKVDRRPDCVADLNGIAVEDGQKVHLTKTKGSTSSVVVGRTLYITAPSFLLTVVGTDASGNSATDTAEPYFRHRGNRWRCI